MFSFSFVICFEFVSHAYSNHQSHSSSDSCSYPYFYCFISNLENICLEAGASLNDIVKLNIYLIDLENFASLNKVMEEKFSKPFPARATVEVARLPKNVTIEVDAIVNLKK